MDELRVGDRPRARVRLNERKEDVDQLSSVGADEGDAEDALVGRIDDELHHAGGLIGLDSACNACERHVRHFDIHSARPRLGFAQADVGDLRIGEHRGGDDAIRATARSAAEQDVEQEPMIVPRAVRKLRPAGYVSDSKYARRGGPITIVDDDVAAPVERNGRGITAKVVGVGAAPRTAGTDRLARSSARACFGRDAADLLTLDRAR